MRAKLAPMSSAQKRGSFPKLVRRHKTSPNRERLRVACGAFRASRWRPPIATARKSFRVSSFIASPRAGISIFRIVTGLLVLLALFACCGWLYFSRRSSTGLPPGPLVYDDAGRHHLQRPLVSHRLRLAGRPDYLIETAAGRVPVELKSGACPRSGPHASHAAQLMTYCVLVENAFARPVPYGVLQYSDAQRQRFRIRRTGSVKFFSWRTRFDASAALETCTGSIST